MEFRTLSQPAPVHGGVSGVRPSSASTFGRDRALRLWLHDVFSLAEVQSPKGTTRQTQSGSRQRPRPSSVPSRSLKGPLRLSTLERAPAFPPLYGAVATPNRSNQRRALRQGTRLLEQLPVFCLEVAAGELVRPAAWELRGRFPQSTHPAEVLRRKVTAAAAGHLALLRQ